MRDVKFLKELDEKNDDREDVRDARLIVVVRKAEIRSVVAVAKATVTLGLLPIPVATGSVESGELRFLQFERLANVDSWWKARWLI